MVASDLKGRYTVTKEFISDPHHPVVLMNVKISGDEEILSRMKCYALLAPHLNGGGAGNSARSIDVAGRRCLLAWKGETIAGDGSGLRIQPVVVRICGDQRRLPGPDRTDMKMTWQFGQALDGNIAVMGEIDVAANREFTIAICVWRRAPCGDRADDADAGDAV